MPFRRRSLSPRRPKAASDEPGGRSSAHTASTVHALPAHQVPHIVKKPAAPTPLYSLLTTSPAAADASPTSASNDHLRPATFSVLGRSVSSDVIVQRATSNPVGHLSMSKADASDFRADPKGDGGKSSGSGRPVGEIIDGAEDEVERLATPRRSRPLTGTIVTPSGGIAPAPSTVPITFENKRTSGSSSAGSSSATATSWAGAKGRLFLASLLTRSSSGGIEGKRRASSDDAEKEKRERERRETLNIKMDAANVTARTGLAPGSTLALGPRPASVNDTRLRRPSSTFLPSSPTLPFRAPPSIGLSRSSSASKLSTKTRAFLPSFLSNSDANEARKTSNEDHIGLSSRTGEYGLPDDVDACPSPPALGEEDPQTQTGSLKALSQLTGLPLKALTDGNRKAVERLTGIRVPELLGDAPRARATAEVDLTAWDDELLEQYQPQEPGFAYRPSSPVGAPLSASVVPSVEAQEAPPNRRSSSTEKARTKGLGIALSTDQPAAAAAASPSLNSPTGGGAALQKQQQARSRSPTVARRPPRREVPGLVLPDHHRPSDPSTYRRSVGTAPSEGGYAAESEYSFSRPVTQVDPDTAPAVGGVGIGQGHGAGEQEKDGTVAAEDQAEGEEGDMFRRRKNSAASVPSATESDTPIAPLPSFRRPLPLSSTSTASSGAAYPDGDAKVRRAGAGQFNSFSSSADDRSHSPMGASEFRRRTQTLNSLATNSANSLHTLPEDADPGSSAGVKSHGVRSVSESGVSVDGQRSLVSGNAEPLLGTGWGAKPAQKGIGAKKGWSGTTGKKKGILHPAISQASALSANSDSTVEANVGKTLASLYLVCGLPKDPACWTLAQPDHLPAHLEGAVPRFWRPEVLGTTVSGQDSDLLSSELDSVRQTRSRNSTRTTTTGKPGQSLHSKPSAVDMLSIGKEELARMQAKAMKLAFPREVEVIASTVQPPSTTHCFSFVVPPSSAAVTDAMGAIGQEWDLSVANSAGTTMTGRSHTWFGACLTVWSHADRTRSEAIRKTVEEGSKAKSAAIARAVKAAAAGRKFSGRLQAASQSPMGILPSAGGLAGRKWSGTGTTSATSDTDTEAFVSESEYEGPSSTMPIAQVPGGTPFWLPYSLVLVSRLPVFDLMTDHLRISWARYHQAIGKHSQQMLKMLNFPAPRPGEEARMPVGAIDSQTFFVAKIPGKTDLSNGALEEVDFTMWPVFRCLSLEHIISIYEVALSPMGRVVFFSRYPVLLNMAVETFRYLLEMRGWQGVCQSVVHARDVKIYLEDPGPYILGMNSQMRPIAVNPPPEVMVVDLDTNSAFCPNPHPHALTRGALRFKIERRLQEALGTFGGIRGVPSEFFEAFPGGRFRPFSRVEIKGKASIAERLVPPPEWNWDQGKVIAAFDAIVAERPRGAIAKMFRRRSYRQAPVLDPSAQHVQDIVRRHATGFVDRRDMLEAKIWKLNRRLTFLMSESMEWKTHFDTFQRFTEKLSHESQDLKTRLEMERRSHKRLTGVVTEQKAKQGELENRLLETEQAWMAAQAELAKAHEIREELERQKTIMVSEMKSIALSGEDSPLIDQIMPRLYDIDELPSRPGTAASNRPSLTSRNLRRISTNSYSGSSGARSPSSPLRSIYDDEDLDGSELAYSDNDSISDPARDEEQSRNRASVIATMRNIQNRLESALRSAGQLDEEELMGYDVGAPTAARSKRSLDSHESKVVPLQRGRRKPTPPPGTVVAPDTDGRPTSPVTPTSPVSTRAALVKTATGTGPRNRAGDRASLLTPGHSIFGSPRIKPSNQIPTPVVDEDNGRDEIIGSAVSNYDDGADSASFVSADEGEESETDPSQFDPPSEPEEDVAPLAPSSPTLRSPHFLAPKRSHVDSDRHSLISVASSRASSQATIRGGQDFPSKPRGNVIGPAPPGRTSRGARLI